MVYVVTVEDSFTVSEFIFKAYSTLNGALNSIQDFVESKAITEISRDSFLSKTEWMEQTDAITGNYHKLGASAFFLVPDNNITNEVIFRIYEMELN